MRLKIAKGLTILLTMCSEGKREFFINTKIRDPTKTLGENPPYGGSSYWIPFVNGRI